MNPKYSRYYTYIRPVLYNKKVQTYSSLAFTLITVAIFSIFAIRPTLQAIVGLQKSIKEQQDVLSRLNKKAEDIALGKKNYDSLDPSLKEKLNNLIPHKPEVIYIINALNQAAQENQASISGIQFQPIPLNAPPAKLPRNPQVSELDFNFNLQGSFLNLHKALQTITSFDRAISIRTININKSTENFLVMSVSAKAYLLKTPSEPKKDLNQQPVETKQQLP